LMRALLERNLVEVDRCLTCRSAFASSDRIRTCPRCGSSPRPLAESICRRISLACQQDPTLVSRIKMEWEDRAKGNPLAARSPLPDGLPPWWKKVFERLPWLERRWRQAKPWRPAFQGRKHWLVVTTVSLLRACGLSVDKIVAVLTGNLFGRLDEKAGETLKRYRKIGESFRRRAVELEVSPTVSREEVWRSLRWARRQASDPRARWSRERPRARRQGRRVRGHPEIEGLESWTGHSGMGPGEEQGHAPPEGRQGITELGGDPAQEARAGRAAEVVAHLAGDGTPRP